MTLNAIVRQSAPRLVERYSTSTVASEFIVKFSGFYEESARRGYIAAALAPLSDSVSFEVVPRDNPMAEYPSDFDVVQLGAEHEFGSGGTDPESVALQALLRHPAVKSITPQRKVTRSIKAIDEESGEERELNDAGEEDVPEDPCGYDDGVGDCARYNYTTYYSISKTIS